jgi:hypothetical protein
MSNNGTVRYHCGGWPEEVNTCFLNSQPTEEDLLSIPDMAATATISVAVSPPPLPPDASISQPASSASPAQASPLPASSPSSPLASSPSASPSPQAAPPPRKRAKTYSEATRASSRAAVLAKRRQIPQLDGCISPPSPPSPPSPQATSPAAKPPSYRLHLQHLRRRRRPCRGRPLCHGEHHRGERLHPQTRPDVPLLPQPPGSPRLHRHPAILSY